MESDTKFSTTTVSGKKYSTLFIPFNVPSSKNSRQFNIQRRRSFKSKAYSKYERLSKDYWNNPEIIRIFKEKVALKPKPFVIYFFFVRDSKRKFDWQNAVQGPLDIMVKNEWMEDDNVYVMVPAPIMIDGAYHKVDKNNPGLYIYI